MRVSPLVFFELPLVIFGRGGSSDAVGPCDASEELSLPLSKAMKASKIQCSMLSGALLGLLCRHRSEQYFTGVDAAFVVGDFRVPLEGCYEFSLL